jgi:hypothetical protein
MNDLDRPVVSIILAPHNGMDHIGPCLASLEKQDFSSFEVIVVDNASTDGTSQYLRETWPWAKTIRSEQNLAYAAGNNLGARHAIGEFLLFLNHDTLVTAPFLTLLVEAMRSNPDIAIAQSRIMMAAEPERVDSVGAYLTRSGMWVHPLRGEPFSDGVRERLDVLGVCGACLMIRREVFFELGGFDDDFVIYFEDADLSLRARLIGHRSVVVPSSVILHWGGVTTGQLPSSFTVFHSFKNRLCLLIKDLSTPDLLLSLPAHLSLCVLGIMAYALRLKPRNALAIASALWWNLRNLSSTLRKRNRIRRTVAEGGAAAYRRLVRPLRMSYFLRTSLSYLSRW